MRAAAVVTGRVLLCLVGMGFGAPAAAQPEGDAAIYAQRHFERGAELYREARFEEGASGVQLVGGQRATCNAEDEVVCPTGTLDPPYCITDPEL